MRPALDLRGAARQVAMDLKVTRMRAVNDNTNHRILFTSGSGQYQPQRKKGAGYADDGRPVRLPRGIVVVDCTANAALLFSTARQRRQFRHGNNSQRQRRSAVVIVDIAARCACNSVAPGAASWIHPHRGLDRGSPAVGDRPGADQDAPRRTTGAAGERAVMEATMLAAEGIEQLRSGQALGPVGIPGTYERAGTVQPWAAHPHFTSSRSRCHGTTAKRTPSTWRRWRGAEGSWRESAGHHFGRSADQRPVLSILMAMSYSLPGPR